MLRCQQCPGRHMRNIVGQFMRHPVYQGLATLRHATASMKGEHYSSSTRTNTAVPAVRQVWNDNRGGLKGRGPSMKARLTYDPLKLAEQVRGLLRKDKVEEAEDVVRLASKSSGQYTVSWNHLIDWKMEQGKVNGAIKTYQEMKKRAQVPDAYTYTIILRGLSEHSHYPQAVNKALSIYHGMNAENSPVQPTIIHTNAALKVCARAGDIDAMFGIAAQLQPRGTNAPNNLTFTTIFNAIRQDDLVAPSDKLSSETLQARKAKAVMDSRRMWDDIVARWRKGDIWIDEELVCSMGRLLLLGSDKDIDDIFSLIEQTMNIPRLVPRLDSEARARIEPSLQGKLRSRLEGEDLIVVDQEHPYPRATDEFKPVTPPVRSRDMSGYAIPGPNTLSMILELFNKLRSKNQMAQYWQLLTTAHKVPADSQNFHSYLRNLRLFRASTETVGFLLEMPTEMMEKKTFRMALSTCVRDKNNPAAFANAGKIMDLMQTHLADPDIPALDSYLEVAITSHASANKSVIDGLPVYSRYGQGKQILRALERLGPHIINLRSSRAYGEYSSKNGTGTMKELSTTVEKDLVGLFRRIVSAYDLVMNMAMVERSIYGDLTARRAKISAWITRQMVNKANIRSPPDTNRRNKFPRSIGYGKNSLPDTADLA